MNTKCPIARTVFYQDGEIGVDVNGEVGKGKNLEVGTLYSMFLMEECNATP